MGIETEIQSSNDPEVGRGSWRITGAGSGHETERMKRQGGPPTLHQAPTGSKQCRTGVSPPCR